MNNFFNWTICEHTWRELRANKLRMCLIALMILYPIVCRAQELCVRGQPSDYFSTHGVSIPYVLICVTGAIGKEVSDGTLALVLARPLTITRYVLSKWITLSTVSAICSVIQLVLEVIVSLGWGYKLEFIDVLSNGAERVLECFALVALMLFFSSLVSGVKDLALYFFLQIASSFLAMVGSLEPDRAFGWIERYLLLPFASFANQLFDMVTLLTNPSIDLDIVFLQARLGFAAVVNYLAVLTISLALAIWALNRKELPYGAD